MAQPTQEELSLACQKVWDLDANYLEPGLDYQINLQEGKHFNDKSDAASTNLFTSVNADVFKRPSYLIFYNLLDNYHRQAGVTETFGPRERKEMSDFLDVVVASAPMQYVHKYLVDLNLADPSPARFKEHLYNMWFSLYRRQAQNDSSGFEHVFVGESKLGEVTGFHNWIQFYIEEGRRNVDYRGYLLPRRRQGGVDPPDETERLISVQFEWFGEGKGVSSMWVGTSPEFELALYTLCFLAGREENKLQIGGYDVLIRCYRIHGDKVGSVFPELLGKVGSQAQRPPRAPHHTASGHVQAPRPGQQPAYTPHQRPRPPPRPQQHQQPHYNQQQQGSTQPQYNQQPQYPQQQYNQGPPYGQQQQQYPQAESGATNQGCGDILKFLLDLFFGGRKKQ